MSHGYLYIQTERGEHPLWTVGHYSPEGRFEPESDWSSREEAARRVHYMNGGDDSAFSLEKDYT